MEAPVNATVPGGWDLEADVVVVGFGAAGACAALEAAASGASVLVLDRFGGGGATALSGGVVYAGGGTPQQRAAGVDDSPGAMFGYLRTEVGDAVPAATLRQFCDGSVAMLAWLEGHGVPFEGSLCPDKTSYPTNRHYLYYSGSELSAAAYWRRAARPQGTQDQGPRHLRRPALRQAGRCRPRRRRPGAHPDHRPRAGHRPRRPGHRGGVHDPARRARLGPAGAPRAAPLVGQALPVRAEGRPDPAPPRGLAGAALRKGGQGRGGPRRDRRGRRLRREPADDARARARADRVWTGSAGAPGRRPPCSAGCWWTATARCDESRTVPRSATRSRGGRACWGPRHGDRVPATGQRRTWRGARGHPRSRGLRPDGPGCWPAGPGPAAVR